MKQKLTLLLLALFTTVGAWAETKTFTVTYAKGNTYGTFYQSNGNEDGGYYWDPKWVSGGDQCGQLPCVTITSDANSISGYNAYCLNGNYTISVPDGLLITGYTMQAKSYEEGASGTEKYITPAGQSAVALNTSSDTEVAVTGLSSNTVTFSITGTAGQTSRVIFSSFTISVQGEIVTSLASADADKAYYIVSRRGFSSTVSGYAANTVKGTNYMPNAFRIVNEGGSYYMKTLNGKYITSVGAQADAASGALESEASNITDFPHVLKIGDNYLNSGTGGTYGIVWNTWGANGSSEYDKGNCYAIIEAPADETLNYSLTDANGEAYTGTYSGVYGVTVPDLDGCAGYTLTNKSWDSDTRTLNATINFPFPVSSNGATNYTYIANYNDAKFIWFVKDDDNTNIWVNKESHTAYNTTYTRFDWSIEPTFSSSAFTFKIKNRATGTYVTSTSSSNSHDPGIVTLGETGTSLTFIQSGGYRWLLPTGKQLSINSSGDNKGYQRLGTYSQHNGTSIKIVERTDFETLIADFGAAALAFSPYDGKIGDGLGQYSGENAAEMQSAYSNAMSGNTAYTAEEIADNTTLLVNPASKLSLNIPATNAFYRIKGYSNNYITSNTAGRNASMNGTASANNIVYYDESQYLIFYGSGLGLSHTHTVAPVGETLNAYTFSEGAQMSKYYIKSNGKTVYGNYDGEYCYDNTANGTKLDRNGSPVTSGSYQTDWTLEEVTTLPVTISAAGYATLYAPVALTIPEGVTAYTATDEGTYLSLTAITDNVIPAEVGVILAGDEGTYNFNITTGGTVTSALTGTVAAIARPNGSYILATGNNGVAFYSDGSQTIPGFKAYLAEGSGNHVKTFIFEDDATGLSEVNGQWSMVNGQSIYNLAGQRLQKMQKGINIVGGKKVAVK